MSDCKGTQFPMVVTSLNAVGGTVHIKSDSDDLSDNEKTGHTIK